jgi:hypothetical protein
MLSLGYIFRINVLVTIDIVISICGIMMLRCLCTIHYTRVIHINNF